MTELLISVGFLLAGAASAATLVRARCRRTGLALRPAVDGLFVMLVAGVLASNLSGALVFHTSEVAHDWTLLLPGSGTAWSLGAIAGATLAGWLWFRARAPAALWAHADNLAVALCLGWGVGRIGCAIQHDHLGRLTSFPLAVLVAGGRRHDLGLYEAGLALGLFGLLCALDRRPRRPGFHLGVAALGYGAGRFLLELLRADDLETIGRHSDPRYFGLTLVAYLAPLMCLCGLALLVRGRTAAAASMVVPSGS